MPAPTRPVSGSSAHSSATRAEHLAERIKAMPIETVRARIAESRELSSAAVVARQAAERRERAEQAAARIRSL